MILKRACRAVSNHMVKGGKPTKKKKKGGKKVMKLLPPRKPF
jgi:hypothetical protein